MVMVFVFQLTLIYIELQILIPLYYGPYLTSEHGL